MERDEDKMSSACQAPWNGAVIHFSGAVYPCDSMSRGPENRAMQIGDLRTHLLPEILRGSPVNEIRNKLLEGKTQGLLCHRCDKSRTCNLYGDPVSGTSHHSSSLNENTDEPSIQRLEIGLTDLCNMRCVMCCLTHGEASPPGTKTKGFMDPVLVQRALSALQPPSPGTEPPLVLLHWVGEPLLHPDINKILGWVDKSPGRLHLVTNGILLTPEITDILLGFSGNHTINVSLNAVQPETFHAINGVDLLEKVHANLLHFLSERKRKDRHENWTVIVSAVILEENRREMADFVAHWQNILEQSGPTAISLNGHSVQTHNQITLLTELENPNAPARFRWVLRSLQIQDPHWPLKGLEEIDDVLLGEKKPGDLTSLRLEHLPEQEAAKAALSLLTVEGWENSQIMKLLGFTNPTDPQTTTRLRALAFEQNRSLFPAPTEFSEPLQALYWLKLCPQEAPRIGPNLLETISFSPQVAKDLAAIINCHPEVAASLPHLPHIPNTEDASRAMLQLANDQPVFLDATPQPWQIEAMASMISRRDRPGFSIRIAKKITWAPSLVGSILGLTANSGDRDEMQEAWNLCAGSTVADWKIRTLRRRWLFGGGQGVNEQIPEQHGWEQLLLGLSITTVPHAQPWAIAIACKLVTLKTAIQYQDLAEIFSFRETLIPAVTPHFAEIIWPDTSSPQTRMAQVVLRNELGTRQSSDLVFLSRLSPDDLLPFQRPQQRELLELGTGDPQEPPLSVRNQLPA
jgi:radical SAM protein with 4Fe4S-binding SPASM domain